MVLGGAMSQEIQCRAGDTTATLLSDGQTVLHVRRGSSVEMRVEDLAEWLAFYERRASRPKARGAYDDDVAALRDLKARLAEQREEGR